jgi:hypothetical protein
MLLCWIQRPLVGQKTFGCKPTNLLKAKLSALRRLQNAENFFSRWNSSKGGLYFSYLWAKIVSIWYLSSAFLDAAAPTGKDAGAWRSKWDSHPTAIETEWPQRGISFVGPDTDACIHLLVLWVTALQYPEDGQYWSTIFWIWRRAVRYKFTDVSEGHTTSSFRVRKQAKQIITKQLPMRLPDRCTRTNGCF